MYVYCSRAHEWRHDLKATVFLTAWYAYKHSQAGDDCHATFSGSQINRLLVQKGRSVRFKEQLHLMFGCHFRYQAMKSYLMQRWNDINRVPKCCGFTTLMRVPSCTLSMFIKEERARRTPLGAPPSPNSVVYRFGFWASSSSSSFLFGVA